MIYAFEILIVDIHRTTFVCISLTSLKWVHTPNYHLHPSGRRGGDRMVI
jgi:hypothetical protein